MPPQGRDGPLASVPSQAVTWSPAGLSSSRAAPGSGHSGEGILDADSLDDLAFVEILREHDFAARMRGGSDDQSAPERELVLSRRRGGGEHQRRVDLNRGISAASRTARSATSGVAIRSLPFVSETSRKKQGT